MAVSQRGDPEALGTGDSKSRGKSEKEQDDSEGFWSPKALFVFQIKYRQAKPRYLWPDGVPKWLSGAAGQSSGLLKARLPGPYLYGHIRGGGLAVGREGRPKRKGRKKPAGRLPT